MHSSKLKAVGKLGIKFIAFLLVCAIVAQGIGYLVIPAKSYTRILFHDLYTEYDSLNDNKNIDLVFLGTSHAYRTFNTNYFDQKLRLNSYNFGTSQQTLPGSYYVLNEILKTNKPKQVVFELTYTCFSDKEHNPLKSVILYQYMKPSLDKYKYLFTDFDLEKIFYALVPAYCFREYLTSEDIADKIKLKSTEEYKTYDPAVTYTSTEWMEEKGFVYTDMEFPEGWIGKREPEPWLEESMNSKYVEYFYKIIDLCREKDIELIFVTSPSPKGSLLEVGNYEEINKYFTDIAKKENIDYYDLNLLRQEIMNLPDNMYYDTTHVNGKGANIVSDVFSRILKEREAGAFEYDKYFYKDFTEATSTITDITNAYYDIIEDENNYYLTAKAHTGIDLPIEYQYWEYFEDPSSKVLVRDWNQDPEYVVSKEECWGKNVIVCTRFVDSGLEFDDVKCQKYSLTFPVILENEDI